MSGRYVNDLGALCPVLEKPEQGLDMLQEAFTHLELTAGEDFFIALNCAGHETFDHVSLAVRICGCGAQYLQVNVTVSSGKCKKGMVLYSAVSSPLDRSKRFTLSSPGRPVHSDTVLGFSWKHSSHAAIVGSVM